MGERDAQGLDKIFGILIADAQVFQGRFESQHVLFIFFGGKQLRKSTDDLDAPLRVVFVQEQNAEVKEQGYYSVPHVLVVALYESRCVVYHKLALLSQHEDRSWVLEEVGQAA